MSSKFTLGPWIIKHEYNVFGGPNGTRGVCSTGGHSSNVEDVESENKANARLIVAAPDLLSVAKEALCMLTGYDDWRNAANTEAPYPEAPYGDLARAILKAEGEAE